MTITSIEKKLVPVKLSPPFSMVASSLSQMKYALSPFRNLILEKTMQFFLENFFYFDIVLPFVYPGQF